MSAVAANSMDVGLLENIGNTPLIDIPLASHADLRVCGKAEFLNPGGSVKDRPALNMIQQGEASGALTLGKILLDSTSGNTGIAYAMIAAAKGYRVKLCLPENASPERQRILKAYGADLVLTSAAEGSDGAARVCQRIYEQDPDRYFFPDQYNNPANWQAHFATTGPEIVKQTNGGITHFVAALGTTGTFTGVSRYLKERLHEIRCVSVQPASPLHGIEGTRHMPSSMNPGIYDPSLADENIWVETEEAFEMARRLAREEGLLIGISGAANVVAAARIAKRIADQRRDGLVVTILCDGGQRYLSEPFWNDRD